MEEDKRNQYKETLDISWPSTGWDRGPIVTFEQSAQDIVFSGGGSNPNPMIDELRGEGNIKEKKVSP